MTVTTPQEGFPADRVERSPSLYLRVADRILEGIREGGLHPGTRLPTERDLGDRYGVSRTVIREAVRHLTAKGVLRTEPGRGALVADVDSRGVRESIELFVARHADLDPEAIGEVREALESAMVRLAVERADTDRLATLRDVALALGTAADDDAATAADLEFHRRLAEASGNPLFEAIGGSLAEVILRMREATAPDPSRRSVASVEHLRIADALLARDEAAALEAVRAHLAASVASYRAALGS